MDKFEYTDIDKPFRNLFEILGCCLYDNSNYFKNNRSAITSELLKIADFILKIGVPIYVLDKWEPTEATEKNLKEIFKNVDENQPFLKTFNYKFSKEKLIKLNNG